MGALLAPDVAEAAADLRRRYPDALASYLLDTVMVGQSGAEVDPAASWLQPATPFGQLLAAAFDCGMTPDDWAAASSRTTDPTVVEMLRHIWESQVLAQFAERYGLTI